MYEEKTYENLLEEALSLIELDIDKQEGSLIRTAIAPCIFYIAEIYAQLDNILDMSFADTAFGEFLDRIVTSYGLSRNMATYAVRKVTTLAAIDIGTRWSINDTTYKINAYLSENIYSAVCEQEGIIGNIYNGELEALDFEGEVEAHLTDIISPGKDIETDNDLRTRFFDYVQAPAASGNANDFKKWALETGNVGKALVVPNLWSVEILVVDKKMERNNEIVEQVLEYITERKPIGIDATVRVPEGIGITITAVPRILSTTNISDVHDKFQEAVNKYIKEIIFESEVISYAKLGSILLSIEGVEDYRDLLLNENQTNVYLEAHKVPYIQNIVLSLF